MTVQDHERMIGMEQSSTSLDVIVCRGGGVALGHGGARAEADEGKYRSGSTYYMLLPFPVSRRMLPLGETVQLQAAKVYAKRKEKRGSSEIEFFV